MYIRDHVSCQCHVCLLLLLRKLWLIRDMEIQRLRDIIIHARCGESRGDQDQTSVMKSPSGDLLCGAYSRGMEVDRGPVHVSCHKLVLKRGKGGKTSLLAMTSTSALLQTCVVVFVSKVAASVSVKWDPVQCPQMLNEWEGQDKEGKLRCPHDLTKQTKRPKSYTP